MIIELDPRKWFAKPVVKASEAKPLALPMVEVSETANAEESVMGELKEIEAKFVSVLESIGKAFEKGLTFAVKYLPAADTIAGFIFTPAVAPLATATAAADLLQNSIVLVEQKYAASGVQSGTGAQKAAEVLTLSQTAVTTLLADPTVKAELEKAGIVVNTDYINRIVSAIVTFLNLQGLTSDASTAIAAPALKTAAVAA